MVFFGALSLQVWEYRFWLDAGFRLVAGFQVFGRGIQFRRNEFWVFYFRGRGDGGEGIFRFFCVWCFRYVFVVFQKDLSFRDRFTRGYDVWSYFLEGGRGVRCILFGYFFRDRICSYSEILFCESFRFFFFIESILLIIIVAVFYQYQGLFFQLRCRFGRRIRGYTRRRFELRFVIFVFFLGSSCRVYVFSQRFVVVFLSGFGGVIVYFKGGDSTVGCQFEGQLVLGEFSLCGGGMQREFFVRTSRVGC